MTATPIQFHKKTPDQLRAEIAALVQQYSDIVHAPRPFVPGESAVPVSGKVIGAGELKMMVEASLDGWLTTGRFNAMFEERLAKFLGIQHLITVNSGSSANLVAFSTLTSSRLGERAIKPGDEVIGVAAGFPTTVNPILQFGAVPVFVDVDLATHNIDASKIEAATCTARLSSRSAPRARCKSASGTCSGVRPPNTSSATRNETWRTSGSRSRVPTSSDSSDSSPSRRASATTAW